MKHMPFINIDDAWDCDGIDQKLRELNEALNYSIDCGDEVRWQIDILQQRNIQLNC